MKLKVDRLVQKVIREEIEMSEEEFNEIFPPDDGSVARQLYDQLKAAESKIKELKIDLANNRKFVGRISHALELPHVSHSKESDYFDKIEAMRHDLVTSEGYWCTDVKADGEALPDGFVLKHKSLGA